MERFYGTNNEKVLVSACLMGEKCRYDGDDCLNSDIVKKIDNPVLCCPEVMGGLPTPRVPAEIIGGNADDVLDGQAQVITITGKAVTSEFIAGAYQTLKLAKEKQVSIAILKEESPSCGSCSVYDGSFTGNKIIGTGITTALLRRHGIRVYSEENFESIHEF